MRDLIAVTNYAIPRGDKTRDGYNVIDACRILEDLGTDVVGLNCHRGPRNDNEIIERN